MGVDSCDDDHLKQLVIICHSHVDLLPKLGVEAEEGRFLDTGLPGFPICQSENGNEACSSTNCSLYLYLMNKLVAS